MFSAIYVHVAKDSPYVTGDTHRLKHAAREDFQHLPSGERIGKIVAFNGDARKYLETVAGVTVFPVLHRPITAAHAALLPHVSAKEGEPVYDIAERLCAYHKLPWFNPEEWSV